MALARAGTAADLDAIVRAHFTAFQSSPVSIAMFPPDGAPPPAEVTKVSASLATTIQQAAASTTRAVPSNASDAAAGATDTDTVFIVVAETAASGVVGYAKWLLVRNHAAFPPEAPTPPHTLPDAAAVAEPSPAKVDVAAEFFGALHHHRHKHMGRDPGLETLAVAPTGQRTGAGSALVAWGAALADAEGLPIFLEATPVGYPLYLRFGFEALGVVDFEVARRWGVVNSNGPEAWGSKSAPELSGPLPDG
ncbi:hypothetical protein HK405_004890, partial [Cladochytrium tenue]